MKNFPIIFLLFICSASLHAQEQKTNYNLYLPKKIISEIQLYVGPSLVTLYGNKGLKDGREMKVGYSAGLGLWHSLGNNWSVGTKFLYERKGFNRKYKVWYYDPTIDFDNCKCTTSLGASTSDLSMDYVSLLIPVRYTVNKTNLYLESGLLIGHLLKAKSKTTDLWDNKSYYSNSITDYKKNDFGISFSVGYKIQIKNNTALHLLVMENYGLLNVTNTNHSNTIIKTNSLSFLVGLNYMKK